LIVPKSILQEQKLLHPPSSGALASFLQVRATRHQQGRARSTRPPSLWRLVRPPERRLQCRQPDQRSLPPPVGILLQRRHSAADAATAGRRPAAHPEHGGSTGNSSASGNPVLQLASGGGLLDACVKAKEPSSLEATSRPLKPKKWRRGTA
jgi:hypothetical protein